jgi:hypothetical protein
MATAVDARSTSLGRHLVQSAMSFALLVSLGACGGGGGGGGGGDLALSLSNNAVTFQSQQYSSVRPPRQTITATARNGELYLQLVGYASASLNCSNTRSCTIGIDAPPDPPQQAGNFTYSLGVRACTDPLCAGELPRQSIAITHMVSPGVQLTTTPQTADLVADQGQTAEQILNLVFTNGTASSVSAAARYTPNAASGWLTLNATLSSLTVSAGTLAPGSYQANVDLTYSGAGFTNQISIPVTYRVTALPSVEHVAPYVAVVGEPRSVVIRGKAFDRMTHPVKFGDVEAQSVTHVSDTELRVTPPAFATPGAYTVSIENDRGFPTSVARYLVVAPQPYAAATVDLSVGNVMDGTPKQVIYDAERQAVYFNRNANPPMRAQYDNGTWVIEALPNAPGGRMFMSPDGDRLYFMPNTTALEYDLENASVAQYENVGLGPTNGISQEVVVLNDGQGLVYGDQAARLFDFATGARQNIQEPDLRPRDSAISPDHGRVLAAGFITDSDVFSLDAGARSFTRFSLQTTSVNLHAYEIAMDRHATRAIVRNRVFDANHALLGSLTDWVSTDGAVFSPDGARAYVVFSWTSSREAELDTFDLSGASSFPQLGPPVTVASECTMPGVAITPDGQTLFIVCDQKFIVRPIT